MEGGEAPRVQEPSAREGRGAGAGRWPADPFLRGEPTAKTFQTGNYSAKKRKGGTWSEASPRPPRLAPLPPLRTRVLALLAKLEPPDLLSVHLVRPIREP